MGRLIVNADDFGLTTGVSEGIVEAHARGVVTSTSLMVDAPAAARAVALAREHPELSIGLHFVDVQPSATRRAKRRRLFKLSSALPCSFIRCHSWG